MQETRYFFENKVMKTYREDAVIRDEVTEYDHAVFVVIDCKLHTLIDSEVLIRSKQVLYKTVLIKTYHVMFSKRIQSVCQKGVRGQMT